MASRRGVSPVLAVVILMSVAVVGGAFLSTIQNVFLQTALSTMEFKITDLRLEKDSQNGCYLFLSVFNSGSEIIKKIHFKTVGDSGHDQPTDGSELVIDLEPGKDNEPIPKFFNESSFFCGNFTTSKAYSFTVNGSSTESTYAVIKDVTVKKVSRK